MTRRLTLAAVAALGMGVLVAPVSARASEPRVAVAQAVPLPRGAQLVSGSLRTSFDVVLAQPRAAALRTFLREVSDPSSPQYHHFLTTAQFAARFGAPAAEVAAVRHYFSSYGVHVGALSRGHLVLHLRADTSVIARAFATSVATVRVGAHRAAQFSATATLPRAIAHDVAAVDGLSTVRTPHALGLAHSATAHATSASTCAAATGGSSATGSTPNALGGYSLQQQGALYGLQSAWAQGNVGTGQTIAVYELGTYNPSNVATYLSCYGLSDQVHSVPVDGGGPSSFSDEATLDVEEAAGLAPGATVDVYTGPNNSTGPLDIYQAIADANTASVVTTSWGTCEADPSGDPAAEQAVFEQMAAQGQTVIAAAGDSGSSDCAGITTNAPAVDDPASQPLVTGVGGLTVNNIAPLNETVWNSGGGGGGAGGGGISSLWSRPAWQNAPGIAPSETMRLVPDLSVMADPSTGFIQYFTGTSAVDCGSNCGSGWSSIGGTSIGAPLVSSLVAVAAQQCGVSRLGLINPALYAMASTGFNDVTTGNNDIFNVGVYSAGPGYDMASGLGSPNATTFMGGLCPVAFDASASTATVSMNRLRANATATVTFALRNLDGGPVADASVSVAASAAKGTVLFNADPSSRTGAGNAAYSVTTDASGAGSVSVSSSQPGPLTLTVTYQNATLLTTVIAVTSSVSSLAAPSITRVVALVTGAQLFTTAPVGARVYQYSLNYGRTWNRAVRRGTAIIINHLAAGVTYHVIVRYIAATGRSRSSRAATVTTRRP